MEDPLRLDDFYPKSSFQEASSCHQQATIRPQPLPDALGGQDFGHVDYAVLYQYWVAALNQALPQTLEIEDPFIDYSWTNCGFGNVEVLTDGTVILSQHNAPAELHIQSVNVAGLPLQSPKTAFNGGCFTGPSSRWRGDHRASWPFEKRPSHPFGKFPQGGGFGC